ncbi:MAG: hypothetical protein RMK60_05835 [Burkholderiales bacterium]|nr:hypothetical protein [Burkholderiales bacterium]
MRALLAVALVSLALLIGALYAASSAFSPLPTVGVDAVLTPADIERARQLYRQLRPALGLREGTERLELSARDLDLALNHLLAFKRLGQGRVELGTNALVLALSLRPPERSYYFNVDLHWLAQHEGPPRLYQVRMGSLLLPETLARPLAGAVLRAMGGEDMLALARRVVRQMRISPEVIQLELVWRPDDRLALVDLAGRHLAGIEPHQLEAYRTRLAELAAQQPLPDFARVMAALFALAVERSQGGDAVAENRALLIALAEAVSGRRLGLPGDERVHMPVLGLGGRTDYVQHFSLSAAMAAVLGEGTADFTGLYKEVRDTRGGSGFSFSDLAADRAGTRLGSLATASEDSARRVQAMLAASRDTADYFPRLHDLPEFLPRAEFERRYGGVGGAGYRQLVRLIERRIDELPLHRGSRP